MKKYSHFIKEMPLPQNWDQRVFTIPGRYSDETFVQVLVYARERAKFVAKGSSRAVFELFYEGRKTALKMAMNKHGLAQNEAEANIIFDKKINQNPLVVPGIDYDTKNKQPWWIHTEFIGKVTEAKFQKLTGVYPYHIQYSVRQYEVDPKTATAEIQDGISFIKNMHDLWRSLRYSEALLSDLDDNIANWGIYDGRVVIADLGFSNAKVRKMYAHRFGIIKEPVGVNWKKGITVPNANKS